MTGKNLFVLFDSAKPVNWIGEIISLLEDTDWLKIKLIGVGLGSIKGNSDIRNYPLVRALGSVKLVSDGNNYFKESPIEAQALFDSFQGIKNYLTDTSEMPLLWLGDTSYVTHLTSSVPNPIIYLDNVTTQVNTKDSAYLNLQHPQNCTDFYSYLLNNDGSKTPLTYGISQGSSYSLQKARLSYSILPGLVKRSLEIYFKLVKAPVEPEIPFERNQKAPNLINLMGGCLSDLGSLALEKFRKPKWELQVFKNTTTGPLEPKNLESFKTIRQSGDGMGLADPTVVQDGTKTYVFAEKISSTWFGSIVVVDLDSPELAEQEVLIESYHLSFPYVFKSEGTWYMIPESSKNKSIDLYKSEDFPRKWVKTKTLLEGKEYVDNVVFQYNDKWWMFTNGREFADSFNEEMHIFHADSLEGPWSSHKLSPIKNDVRLTRSAGAIFFSGRELYRPVQDCSIRYGYRILWMKVLELSEDDFREEFWSSIHPDFIKGAKAIHSINSVGQYSILDKY